MSAWWKPKGAVRSTGPGSMWDWDGLDRAVRVRRVLVWILGANLVLVIAKVIVGAAFDSLAVLGDAAHSGVDTINNVVALTALYYAAAPPDEEHPYGHGKFETLGALVIAGFLSVTCFELLRSSVTRLIGGAPPPEPTTLGILVLAATMVVNVAVAWFEDRRGRQLESELLIADARHTRADVYVTLSVLIGLGLVQLGWGAADSVLAILVSIVVAHSGYQILRRTVPVLVDRRAVAAEQIGRVAAEVPGVESVTDIRSRGRPGDGFAELTIRVHPATGVREAHAIADQVEQQVAADLGLTNVVVHVEPRELH